MLKITNCDMTLMVRYDTHGDIEFIYVINDVYMIP
jgi:hypothetical protein